MEEGTVVMGSGNVFADIGLDNPEELLLKAQLGLEITKTIERRGLSDSEAVKVLSISQDELLSLRRNPLDRPTSDLLRFLNYLDQDVRLVVTPRRDGREQTAA
jgi:predicted XRE-type DNA-binding protein